MTVTEVNREVCETHFCLASPELRFREIPIAGTPAPKPCPFCGESAAIELKNQGTEADPTWWAFAHCDGCGVRGPEADGGSEGDDESLHGLCVEAARMWNARKGGGS